MSSFFGLINMTFWCFLLPFSNNSGSTETNAISWMWLFLRPSLAIVSHIPLHPVTHSKLAQLLILSMQLMSLQPAALTAAFFAQMFLIKLFPDFDERNKTKFTRSVLPAHFCVLAFASNSFLIFNLFFTRNLLTSKLLSRLGFLYNSAVEQWNCCSSTAAEALFLIAYRLSLIFYRFLLIFYPPWTSLWNTSVSDFMICLYALWWLSQDCKKFIVIS